MKCYFFVTEAYKKIKQAEKIRKSHPSIAANVYWNAATGKIIYIILSLLLLC